MIEHLVRNGKDRYKFTEAEEGCRYWTCVAVQEWETGEMIQKGSAVAADKALSCYYRYPTGREARNMEIGEFF